MPDSLWAATAAPALETPPFAGDATVDIAIVGGGYTGLSAALHAADGGAAAMVLEAAEPGWGASGRNNGQVVAAMKQEPDEIAATFGAERARRLLDAVGAGPDLVFGLIDRHGMACDARRCGVVTAAHSEKAFRTLEARNRAWADRGVELETLDRRAVAAMTGSERYFGGSLDRRGGTLNPLGYARGLARAAVRAGASVHGASPVTGLRREDGHWRLDCPGGTVRAETVLLCTNAYTGDLWPGLRRTVVPVRTPQVVSQPLSANLRKAILPGGQIMSDTRKLLVGCRMHPDGRLHLGGAWASAGAESRGLYARLERHGEWLFPFLGGIEWAYRWTGWIAMTPDRYPRLHELAPGLLAGLGYNGRGICMATITGKALAERALGAPLDSLALPAVAPRAVAVHGLRRIAVPALLGYYRLRDRLG